MRTLFPLFAGAFLLLGFTPGAYGQSDGGALRGADVSFGEGTVSAYVILDADGNPSVIGTTFDSAGLDAPPEGHSNFKHCTDRNGDGTIDKPAECVMTHEFVVPLPEEIAAREDVPFKWVLLNWNPMGHIPPGIYDSPHFDVHFMIESQETIFGIESGPCGPEFVRCDQFELGKKPVPVNYKHPDFQDVEAVVPAMGNHLIDVTGPEFQGEPFTRSWIYGNYDGRITFYEEMLTMDYLKSKPGICNPIKRTEAVAVTGFYPTLSCVGYDEGSDTYTVSMEGFEYRESSPPVMAEAEGE
ncbi:MAG TPA: hypothetical protein VMO47_16870 [Rhodothermales bacterium]|nr:hypothetical protein [Rhodothermales bacterium]